jgi:hybrid cluster-associated redox disulfide protein
MINLPPLCDALFALQQSCRRKQIPPAVCSRAKRLAAPALNHGSMNKIALTAETTVDQVMTRWPATIRVFLDHRMKCVGCPIASFHSVHDASREHELNPAAFLLALQGAVPV